MKDDLDNIKTSVFHILSNCVVEPITLQWRRKYILLYINDTKLDYPQNKQLKNLREFVSRN
jgi:hypothetical protein